MLKLVTVAALALTAFTVTAQTLESDGWTPVTSSQVVNLPSRYQRPPEQQQLRTQQPDRPSTPSQQQPFRPKTEPPQPFLQPQRPQEPEVSPYLPDLEPQRTDYENQWDGFYGTKTEPTSPPKPTEEVIYEDKLVQQLEQSENDVLQPEMVDKAGEKDDGGVAVIPDETEKPPLIIYPAASIDETPLSGGPVDVQTPAQTVPDFLQPKRNQAVSIKKKAPALQRFPAPGKPPVSPRAQPPQPAGTPRQPLPSRPTPAQPPRLRGAPRRPLPPRGPPQQALPRNSVVGPPPVRSRPPVRKPYPPRRAPPSGGILDGLKCASKGVIADVKLNDRTFMQSQINCILENGPCDKTGQLLKRIGPDVVRGGCPPPCDPCKRQQINKAIKKLQDDYPREFRAVMRKFNPSG